MNTLDVYRDFHKALFSFIKRRVQNEYDAEDILQEVFRKIHSSIHHLTDEKNIRSWVYPIRKQLAEVHRAEAGT